MVAAAGLVLNQSPPAAASVRRLVAPTHTDDAPDMADGVLLTVTTVAVLQPVDNV
jgi:hypothetical protein